MPKQKRKQSENKNKALRKTQLGKLGEKTLDFWASQAGITSNKASEDEQGWDFFLEFPLENLHLRGQRLPFDQRPSPLKCVIQVKATDKRPGKWPVKLDNWERLVKDRLPAFFLVCEFDGKDACQRAYLVHIDKDYIALVLKKLRELSAQGIEEIHEYKLSFTYTAVNALPALDGHALSQALKNDIGPDLNAYSLNKAELGKTTGYEDGGHEIDFTVKLPDGYTSPAEYLADFSLGLISYIEPERITIKDTRFGIEVPGNAEIFEGGRIEMDMVPHADKAALIFSLGHPFPELQIEAEIYTPQGVSPELIDKHRKMRISAPYINLIIQSEFRAAHLKFKFPPLNEEIPLKNLYPVSALILLIQEAIQNNRPIEHAVVLGNKRLPGQMLNLTQDALTLSDEVILSAKAIKNAWVIAKKFDIEHKIILTVNELGHQSIWLDLIASISANNPHPLRLVFFLDENENLKELCIPYVFILSLGNYKLLVAIAAFGAASPLPQLADKDAEASNYEVITKDVRLYSATVFRKEEELENFPKERFRAIKEQYKDTHDIFIAPGFNDQWLDEG